MTCKHRNTGYCQRCEYKADLDDDWDVFEIRRSPSAPYREEWKQKREQDGWITVDELIITKIIDRCATCRHEYEKKEE